MRTRPKHLVFYALMIIGVALSLPLQIIVLYGDSLLDLFSLAAKMTPLNWAIFYYSPLVAVTVFRASPLMMVSVPVLAALVGYNNWLVGEVGTDYSSGGTALASVVFCGSLFGIFTRDVRQLMFDPGQRRWLSAPRFRVEFPVRVRLLDEDGAVSRVEFLSLTWDVSETGMYIPLAREHGSVVELRSAPAIEAGVRCRVELKFSDGYLLECQALAVRVERKEKDSPNAEYPPGMGFQFLGLSAREKRMISFYLKRAPVLLMRAGKLEDGMKVAA